MGVEDNTVDISAKVACDGLDEVLEKVERLRQLLEEANSLADELASRDLKVTVSCGEK